MQVFEKKLRVQCDIAEENERLYCALYDIADAYGIGYDDGSLDIDRLCKIVKDNAPYGVLLRDNIWVTANSFVYDENLIKYFITSAQKKYRHFGIIKSNSDNNNDFFINTEEEMRKHFYGNVENVPISKEHLYQHSKYMDEMTFIRYIDTLKERGLL